MRLLYQTENARAIAEWAHSGQKYGTETYFDGHLAKIAACIAKLGYGDLFQAVGWLHDVVEDTDITLEDLISWGVVEPVVFAVDNLTKHPGEKGSIYLDRVGLSIYSIVSKYADTTVNLNKTLRDGFTDQLREKMAIKKYKANIEYLDPMLPDVIKANALRTKTFVLR